MGFPGGAKIGSQWVNSEDSKDDKFRQQLLPGALAGRGPVG